MASNQCDRFALHDYIDSTIRQYLALEGQSSTVRIGYSHYYNFEFGKVLVPLSNLQKDRSRGRSFNPYVYESVFLSEIFQRAELMRWSLVDESVPLRAPPESMSLLDIFDGGRESNALALNLLGYWPALPEFREVMIHGLDMDLRVYCVEAIGSMGQRAVKYFRDIQDCIKESNDFYLKRKAVLALTKLSDVTAVPLFMGLLEETITIIQKIPLEDMLRDKIGYVDFIRDLVLGLIKLDPKVARSALAICLATGNPFIRHFTKNAFLLSGKEDEFLLLEGSWLVLFNSLPNNPSRCLIENRY